MPIGIHLFFGLSKQCDLAELKTNPQIFVPSRLTESIKERNNVIHRPAKSRVQQLIVEVA